jgi:hypothetical protein
MPSTTREEKVRGLLSLIIKIKAKGERQKAKGEGIGLFVPLVLHL